MLSTEDRIRRLESILDRVRRNRTHAGYSAISEEVFSDDEVARMPHDLPSPMEPQPVQRLSIAPEAAVDTLSSDISDAPAAVAATALPEIEEPAASVEAVVEESAPPVLETAEIEEEPPVVEESAPPVLETAEIEEEPPVVEEPAASVEAVVEESAPPVLETAEIEEEPPVVEESAPPVLETAEIEEEPPVVEEAAPPVLETAEAEESAPLAEEVEIRQVEAADIQATSAVVMVRGQISREWTLHAVLERAWRVGKSDIDEA